MTYTKSKNEFFFFYLRTYSPCDTFGHVKALYQYFMVKSELADEERYNEIAGFIFDNPYETKSIAFTGNNDG